MRQFIILTLAFFVLTNNSVESALAQTPLLSFARCNDHNVDVAVQERGDNIRVHFHVVARGCVGRTAFVRLRCVEKKSGSTHLSERQFPVRKGTEVWSLYLDSPRFTDRQATYQIEIGSLATDISEISSGDSVHLDAHVMNDSFAWVLSNNKIDPYEPNSDVARSIFVLPKVVEFGENGAFFVDVAAAPAGKNVSLRYAVVNLPQSVDGERAARLIQSNN